MEQDELLMHELIDRISCLMQTFLTVITDHKALELEKDLNHGAEKAYQALYDFYQAAAEKRFTYGTQ